MPNQRRGKLDRRSRPPLDLCRHRIGGNELSTPTLHAPAYVRLQLERRGADPPSASAEKRDNGRNLVKVSIVNGCVEHHRQRQSCDTLQISLPQGVQFGLGLVALSLLRCVNVEGDIRKSRGGQIMKQ